MSVVVVKRVPQVSVSHDPFPAMTIYTLYIYDRSASDGLGYARHTDFVAKGTVSVSSTTIGSERKRLGQR